jgi:molybdopterin-guanine dinucleotide biosynthesis protein
MSRPIIIAVGGFASNVGKTTLMCELLRARPGWEAIKTTRGHYRSCGKDPHACCVSHLLSDEPVIRSGRDQTYANGKDTGRYWDAGASNVHWLITTEDQVEQGIKRTLGRVQSEGVFIEGNSFTRFVDVDYLIMVAGGDDLKIKGSARRALVQASALYVREESQGDSFSAWSRHCGLESLTSRLPIYSPRSFPDLLADLNKIDVSVVLS